MKTGNFTASNVAKPVKSPSVGLYINPSLPERDSVEAPKPSYSKFTKLTPNPEVRVEQPYQVMPDSERKTARVQVKGPHDSSSAVQSATTFGGTKDQGVDPITTIYLDSSTGIDQSNAKATQGTQADETTNLSVPNMLSRPSSLYLTADNGIPSGNPCARSTRQKEQETIDLVDLSIQATQGSDDVTRDPEPKDETDVISPEQLRFTAAISEAMSKELAPLLAGRDLAHAKPSVYRGSKDGSIDGWILVTRRYLKRTQSKASLDDQARIIIVHLEGESRNYVINKAESERDAPEKVFKLLSSRFGVGGNRMQVRQAFLIRAQQEKEDWMQYLDALEGLRSQGFPQEPITTKRSEILQRFMEGYAICCGGISLYYMHQNPSWLIRQRWNRCASPRASFNVTAQRLLSNPTIPD